MDLALGTLFGLCLLEPMLEKRFVGVLNRVLRSAAVSVEYCYAQ